MNIVLIRKMNYYISQDICLQSWGINFENQKKLRRVFWKFLKKIWDLSHSLWGWKIHPWFLRHFNDPFQMRHRIRGPHFRTPVSRAPFWDTRIEWLISRFRMWGPHFETQRSSAKFWDTECEGPSWRHLDRVLDFKTPNPRAPFQDTQIECSISRHQMEGRSNKTQKTHSYLTGNRTPVICMTVHNLTTIPPTTACYTWWMILMCWRSSP